MRAGVRGAKETERRTIKTNAHRLSALQSARMTCIRFWADTEVMKVFHNQPRHRRRRQHHKPRDTRDGKRSTAKRQSHTKEKERERGRQTPTHNRTPACLRAKGATSTSFPTLCLLLFLCQCRSHRALLICVTFSCARLEFATLVTRFTRRTQPNPLLSTIYHLPASAVSPWALFEESKSVSDSLSFFLSFFWQSFLR